MSKKRRALKDRLAHSNALFGSRTDIGCIRERNEDSLVVSPPLFSVADGMGGHAAGDVASEVAVRTLQSKAPDSADVDALGEAVIAANHAVINEARRAGLQGMGTTMTAVIVDGDRLAIAHVGDSRAYLLHHGKLQQLTRDHSLMADMIEAGRLTPEEARHHPNRSIITRALGSDPNMEPDLYEVTASAGDRLLICSDGLSSMIEDEAIQSELARIRDPQRCASALVNDAIAAGGLDNVTVIVVDISGDSLMQQKKHVRRSRAWFIAIMLALVTILAGAGYALYSYTHTAAYLIAENGKVVVYQGVPGSVMGLEMHWLDHETDVSVDDLQPGVKSRIESGITVDNLDEANNLVSDYEAAAASKKAAAAKASSTSTTATSTSSSTVSATTGSSSR